jgi:hypothetical protein
MTKINGLEYAESNYPNYWWFWTYPICSVFYDIPAPTRKENGDPAAVQAPERWQHFAGGDGTLIYREAGDWLEFYRCPCGVGHTTRWGIPNWDGPRWLCPLCGRGKDTLVKWIGRRTANRWEWKPESELPVDLTPTGRIPPETDFDARVKAAVEVEVAIRMAAVFSKVKDHPDIAFPCTKCDKPGVPGPCLVPACHGTCELKWRQSHESPVV